MNNNKHKTAIVVGAGPNGLAAAITLAQAGVDVTVYERNEVIGGACRSSELIKKGVFNDVGSSVYPMVLASPFFQKLSLEDYGLKWITSPYALAHPLDDGTAVILSTSMEETVSSIDSVDKTSYARLVQSFIENWQTLIDEIMQFPKIPVKNALPMIKFGTKAILPVTTVAHNMFKGERSMALIAGMGAHSVMKLNSLGSFAPGFMLMVAAHVNGWPIPMGGSQRIVDAMSGYFKTLGGKIVTDCQIQSIEQLPQNDILLLDITPKQLLGMGGNRLSERDKKKLSKYRYGPGVFKMDWILDGPIPWQSEECYKANTIHLGGYMNEITAAENDVHNGKNPKNPFVFLAQPSLFDNTRAPNGEHIVWGYCHVPNGSTFDMTDRIEAQIERFAPGFKKQIVSRHVMSPLDMERDNPNCIGGDITGGEQTLKKLLFPPVSYKTPLKNMFLCSSSTPPSAGVHGMCGFRAAEKALKNIEN